MLIRTDLPADFRKDAYDMIIERVSPLTSLLANPECLANSVIQADAKGHANWMDTGDSEGARESMVMVVGQLDEGIKVGCMGNKARDSSMITDKTRVKFPLPLVIPTKAPQAITDLYNDQVFACVEQQAAGEAKSGPVGPNVRLESRGFARAPGVPGHATMTGENAVIHMSSGDLYVIPPRLDAVTQGVSIQRSSRRAGGAGGANTAATAPENTGTNPVTLQTTYAASDFPDYDASRFSLSRARAVQFDFRDIENKLVPTPRLHEVFRPGTLVICTCSLSMWKFTKEGEESHTYQLIVKSMRVIDDTPVYVDYTTTPEPVAGTPLPRISPQKRLAEFDSLDFTTPTKKVKTLRKRQ
ncbi:hypothetical protein BOTBODRAFT_173217 [Botryobasidium botryosum FD-172 SS1]|uniref:Uncharacterized protein n=1 Tax=Botryobasidium botryosum (strain FD-172 SS1) TaxID=930990 RepID=A0A067MLD4_BOTB1|nr:hypothetical protein BOTBODRAFT_173217 [Botryobasidium botryosum FD-172 SS1]